MYSVFVDVNILISIILFIYFYFFYRFYEVLKSFPNGKSNGWIISLWQLVNVLTSVSGMHGLRHFPQVWSLPFDTKSTG